MMANFVITHGGRAILNDVVLRGYVHALGGFSGGDLRRLLRENVSSLIRRKTLLKCTRLKDMPPWL